MTKALRGRTRRDVIKAAGAVAATAVTGFPYIARAQNNPIKVGMVTISSGRVAMLGSTASHGALMNIEAFNAAGGLGGRPIELILRDSKGKPEESARLARELVNSDGCIAVFDCDTSAA